MTDHIESEFKLRARAQLEVAVVDAALRELDVRCRQSATRRHVDTYLDDSAGSLLRAGVGLRLRAAGAERSLTCKLRGSIEGCLHVRRELEAPWPASTLPERADELPAPVRGALRALLGDRELRPHLRLEVRRDLRILTRADADLCELAIDTVTAIANDRAADFQELELEVRSGVEANERLAHELRQRLPVEFARDDKPTHAAALLGLEQRPS